MISEPAGTRGTTKRDGWADVPSALEDGQGEGSWSASWSGRPATCWSKSSSCGTCEVPTMAPSEADLRDDPEDPTRRLIRIIIGAVHAHNWDMTVLRMQRGKRRKQQRGGYLGGTTRYGYHPVNKELTPDPTEQTIAHHIRRLHRADLSIRRIADQLDAERIPAKRGGPWHPTTVARVLQRTPSATSGRP